MREQVVYKYAVPDIDGTELDLPVGAVLADFAIHDHSSFVWFLIDRNEDVYEKRKFAVTPTGCVMDPEEWKYIRTCQDIRSFGSGSNIHYVWHLFERIE